MKQFTGYKRGINLGGWLSQCCHTKNHYDTFINEKDIEQISSWGLDHIRLPIDYELIENDNGEYSEEGFSYIDKCLLWCQKHNLKIILDLHKIAGYSFDNQQQSNFFDNKLLQNRFISLWETFAIRYGKYTNNVSFELLNEVVEETVSSVWNEITYRTIKSIRKYAPDINIIVGGVRNNSIQFLDLLDMPYDEHIIFTFHFYEPTIFTHQAAHWVDKMPVDFKISYPNNFSKFTLKTEMHLPYEFGDIYRNLPTNEMNNKLFIEKCFSEAVQFASQRNVALYCGEYGVIDKADINSTLNWFTDIHETFEKYGISRAAWNYKSKDFGITDFSDKPIFDELIKLL